MDQQELVSKIEDLIVFNNGIELFVKELVSFFDQPRSKLEITNYITERSLSKMFDKNLLDSITSSNSVYTVGNPKRSTSF